MRLLCAGAYLYRPEHHIIRQILTGWTECMLKTYMKITTTKEELVIRIPLWQKSYDAINQFIGYIANVIGCIDGDKFGFIQVIDLGYKGSFDFGGFIVELSDQMNVEEFREICEKNDICIHEYPLCAYCGDTIFGPFTMGDKGNMCYQCENKLEKINNKKNDKKKI